MLEKWIWTEADFDVMGWHDATVRAVAFLLESYEFSLDIDHIFKWIPPERNDDGYRFVVAPSTLVFHNVYQLSCDLELNFDVQIEDVNRADARVPRNAEHVGKSTEWLWTFGIRGGSVSFRATGFDQYVRRQPMLVSRQSLSLDERGGLSFARTTGEGLEV